MYLLCSWQIVSKLSNLLWLFFFKTCDNIIYHLFVSVSYFQIIFNSMLPMYNKNKTVWKKSGTLCYNSGFKMCFFKMCFCTLLSSTPDYCGDKARDQTGHYRLRFGFISGLYSMSIFLLCPLKLCENNGQTCSTKGQRVWRQGCIHTFAWNVSGEHPKTTWNKCDFDSSLKKWATSLHPTGSEHSILTQIQLKTHLLFHIQT